MFEAPVGVFIGTRNMGRKKNQRSTTAIQPVQVNYPAEKDIVLPERVLHDFSQRYQGLWRMVEDVRANPQQRLGLRERWNQWCYLPVNVATSCLAHLKRGAYSLQEAELLLTRDARLACALAAWRMTKGVYSFDPDVLQELFASDPRDGLPEDVFLRMPEWCVYIPTPGVEVMKTPMHGFFAWIDDHFIGTDMRRKPPELNFEVLLDPRTAPDVILLYAAMTPSEFQDAYRRRLRAGMNVRDALPRDRPYVTIRYQVELTHGSFTQATMLKAIEAEHVGKEAASSLRALGHDVEAALWEGHSDEASRTVALQEMADTLLRLSGLVLYLCAEEADVAPEGAGEKRNAIARLHQQGVDVPPALRLRKWDVGYRIGAALRLARKPNERNSPPNGGGTSPRPHVRRAHWHAYWHGPRDGEQLRKVRWLPHIPVCVTGPDDLVPTLRKAETPIRRPPPKP